MTKLFLAWSCALSMIKKLSLSLGCCALFYCVAGAAGNVTQLTITGNVLAATCGEITVNNGQAVNFTKVGLSNIRNQGFNDPVKFFISFDNCHSDIRDKVAMAFSATTVPGSGDAHIALNQSDPDSASGLAIALKDPLDNFVLYNGGLASAPEYALSDGVVNLEFNAYLVPVGSGWENVQPGKIRATATFNVEYR